MDFETNKLYYLPPAEVKRIRQKITDPVLASQVLADMFRLNVLSMVMEGHGGHIGSSLSCLDIITWLWSQEMKNPNEITKEEADILFSSKGHDVPAFYALLIGFEKIDYDLIHTFRRIGGLAGHPDIATSPPLITNTGSLGMGISKARGMALANRLSDKTGRIYVITGDGELQEGQIWESLQPVVNHQLAEITVIVDHNKMQTDSLVSQISDLGEVENKFKAFGWAVARCDGHDFVALRNVFNHFKMVKDRPQVLIADTIKSKGVSFMESTRLENQDNYRFHSGLPTPKEYRRALEEITERINRRLVDSNINHVSFDCVPWPKKPLPPRKPELPVEAYGEELITIAKTREDVVVLDGDLMADLGIRKFRSQFADRYFENGIAEQDMVSVAGGLALLGKLPIVSSYACFLSTRSNEQIYNNASEGKKIIYIGALAGVLPAGPGHSHQSVRDISALGSIPGLVMIQPADEAEARLAIRWAIEKNSQSTYLRFSNVALDLPYQLPPSYQLEEGQGVFLLPKEASVAIIAYGQTMLKESFLAAEILNQQGIKTTLINLPWLNRLDLGWLKNLGHYKLLVTIDDHYRQMGQGEMVAVVLLKIGLNKLKIVSLGLDEIPACGENDKVLSFHGLNAKSIAQKVKDNH